MALCDKFAIVNDKQMNVYSIDKLIENQEVLVKDDQTAVEVTYKGKNMILPVREVSNDMSRPGVYMDNGPFIYYTPPDRDQENSYCPPPDKIFDMRDISGMQEYVTKKEEFDQSVTALLETDPEDDSIFRPPFLKSDSPEMRALKESVVLKSIDLDKYASRFGENYPNDKRKFKDDNITSFMLKRICENIDIEVDMVFRDAKGKIANPMNKIVRINMVPGYGNNVSIEDP